MSKTPRASPIATAESVGPTSAPRAEGLARRRAVVASKLIVAAVWLVFGLGFKVLGLVPRHRAIVAATVGEDLASALTVVVGLAETGLAVWVLSGVRPRTCAAVQTLAIATMNGLELARAEDLLLAPIPMLFLNAALLSVAWFGALQSAGARKEPPCSPR